MKKISTLFLLALLSLTASPASVEIGGIWYNLIPKGKVHTLILPFGGL